MNDWRKEPLAQQARKRFNKIMDCIEDLNVLDEDFVSYDKEFKPKSVTDMVKEAEYQLSLFYENGHSLNDLYYEDRKQWRKDTAMLKRFISRFKN